MIGQTPPISKSLLLSSLFRGGKSSTESRIQYIEIYTKVGDEEGSSVEKKPFMGGQRQAGNSVRVVEAI